MKVYIFSHSFLNKLISFDFTPNEIQKGHSEILDYFISFLKMITLKLVDNPQLVIFFLNDKNANSFPLYATAIKLYNNKESMIRTAVRTITLSLYSCKIFLGHSL